MFKQEVNNGVGSTQYGVASPGSCTSLRHGLLIDWAMNPDFVLVGIDLENMHNSVKIRRLAHQVAHRTPRMAELLKWLSIGRNHVYRAADGELHVINKFPDISSRDKGFQRRVAR